MRRSSRGFLFLLVRSAGTLTGYCSIRQSAFTPAPPLVRGSLPATRSAHRAVRVLYRRHIGTGRQQHREHIAQRRRGSDHRRARRGRRWHRRPRPPSTSARRLSARSAPTNSAMKSFFGAASSRSGGSHCTRRAVPHDGDQVAHADRLVDIVGDEDHGLAQPRRIAEELGLQAARARSGRPRRTARPSASPADRRRARAPRRRAGAVRPRDGADSASRYCPARARPATASRRPGARSARRASRAVAARSRCSRRWSCAGTGRPAG